MVSQNWYDLTQSYPWDIITKSWMDLYVKDSCSEWKSKTLEMVPVSDDWRRVPLKRKRNKKIWKGVCETGTQMYLVYNVIYSPFLRREKNKVRGFLGRLVSHSRTSCFNSFSSSLLKAKRSLWAKSWGLGVLFVDWVVEVRASCGITSKISMLLIG